MTEVKERTHPWLTEGAIALMDIFFSLNRNTRVLETGMGASTIWLEKRCRFITTIEHDSEWFYKIFSKITAGEIHQQYHTNSGLVIRNSYANFHLKDRPYNVIIDEEADNHYDLILIDGRDRVKCIESAIPKLKSGGWFILDNSEREYYQLGIDQMSAWTRIDCAQLHPDKYGFTYSNWTTSIFIKP